MFCRSYREIVALWSDGQTGRSPFQGVSPYQLTGSGRSIDGIEVHEGLRILKDIPIPHDHLRPIAGDGQLSGQPLRGILPQDLEGCIHQEYFSPISAVDPSH
jgi:hypothetical protein